MKLSALALEANASEDTTTAAGTSLRRALPRIEPPHGLGPELPRPDLHCGPAYSSGAGEAPALGGRVGLAQHLGHRVGVGAGLLGLELGEPLGRELTGV